MTTATWNSLIRKAVNSNNAQEALFLFRQMQQIGLRPDKFTLPFIAKACAKLSNLSYAQNIHTHVIKSGFSSDVFVNTTLVDAYLKCRRLDYAHYLFDDMPERDTASWNVILVGLAQLGYLDRFLSVFQEMRFAGFGPDSVTVMSLIRIVLESCKKLDFVKSIHSLGLRVGINTDVDVSNTWVAAYAKCSDLDSSLKVFEEIEINSRTVVSYNSMISSYAKFNKFDGCFSFFKLMLYNNFRPDLSTIVSLLSACSLPEALSHGRLIHAHSIHLGCDSSIAITNTLISMYSKCKDIDSARFLFNYMSSRTTVSWTAMISGYAENCDMAEALTLFHEMEESGEKPDVVTVLCLVSGCGQTGKLELGKWIDTYADINGLKTDDLMVCNALIDMYSKCGSIVDARTLFDSMHEKNVVSWTAMISGCALNGESTEALAYYHRMMELNLKPNHITFLAVLQACSHTGFLEKAQECFNTMTQVYNISPGLDHYSCMADLLGRKGKLKEAFKFVQNMPMKPDSGIWSALLSACKIYRNLEIGEVAACQLLEMDPESAAPYVEMANIYASVGKWDGVSRMRSMMKLNKVRKYPGKSIVEIDGKSCVFTVEDRDHLDCVDIYRVLDSLTVLAKDEDYYVHEFEGYIEQGLIDYHCQTSRFDRLSLALVV